MKNDVKINLLKDSLKKSQEVDHFVTFFTFKVIFLLLLDLVFIVIAFSIVHRVVRPSCAEIFPYYIHPFIFFAAVWVASSFIFKKYILIKPVRKWIKRVVLCDVCTVSIIILLILFSLTGFSLYRIIAVMVITLFFEFIFAYFYALHRRITNDSNSLELFYRNYYATRMNLPDNIDLHEKIDTSLKNLLLEEIGEAFYYIDSFLNHAYSKVRFIHTDVSDTLNAKMSNIEYVVNLCDINQFKRVSKYFLKVNSILPVGAVFIGKFQTYEGRKTKIYSKFPQLFSFFVYFAYLLWHRIAPKLSLTKKIYFLITGGYNRALSKGEVFGRLYSCGFEVIDEKVINEMLYFVSKKRSEPLDIVKPSYGPFVRLNRVGENGKMIGVYKMRTMYAYSEFLQEYVYNLNSLDIGGKIKNDFRVTRVGKIMRKVWLDELPMLINVFRGEMKIVGVRPLSKHYFSLYSKELQEKRVKTKPGLLPPFYYDLPKTLDEVMASELKYLEAYEKAPFKTDWDYFWRAMHNIFLKKVRSS